MQNLENTKWFFGRNQERPFARLELLPNGLIGGYSNPNERKWRQNQDESLDFLNAKGDISTHFPPIQDPDQRWEGTFRNKLVIHYLLPVGLEVTKAEIASKYYKIEEDIKQEKLDQRNLAGVIKFLPNGKFLGYPLFNDQVWWTIKDGNLCFVNNIEEIETRFRPKSRKDQRLLGRFQGKNYILKALPPKNNQFTYSFCTCVMNRLAHIQETLPHNLDLLRNLPNTNLVLLNYNSYKDDLHNWVLTNFHQDIKNKKLIYIRTQDPKFWSEPHATNICNYFASGDILVNTLGDNFLSEAYLDEVFAVFSYDENAILRNAGNPETGGRIAISKANYIKLGGWDETMDGLMRGDVDFAIRAVVAGCEYFRSYQNEHISHNIEERIENERFKVVRKALIHNRSIYDANRLSGTIDPNKDKNITPGQCILEQF